MSRLLFQSAAIFLLIISFYFHKKSASALFNRVIFSIIALLSYLYIGAYLLLNYLSEDGINSAVIYHLKYGLEEAGWQDFWQTVIVSILFIIFGLVIFYWLVKKNYVRTNRRINIFMAYLILFLSLAFNPANFDIYRLRALYSPGNKAVAPFDAFYEKPEIKEIGKPKNLIIIYTEGLEQTYFNETIFPGLLKGLRQLQDKSTYFTNIKQIDGASWTIGGIVASQCGLPLVTPTFDGNRLNVMEEFMPSAVCLSDLLKNQGYRLAYFGGASLNFAGKGKFFASHNYDEIYGSNELMPLLDDKKYRSDWGPYDDTLFDLAYERYEKMAKSFDKTAMAILTLDTHHPEGHISRSCGNLKYQDGSNPILNSVACSDYLISRFVERVQRSENGSSTVIAILSDHLAHGNTATNLLNMAERKNLFMIIEPDNAKKQRIDQLGSALDIGPTMLPFVGYEGKIGLGRNLIDMKESAPEISQMHGYLPYWSREVIKFWNLPPIKEAVLFDTDEERIRIDGKYYSMPALIELNEKLEINIKFGKSESRYLYDAILALDEKTPYFLVDKQGRSAYYLTIGKGKECRKEIKLANNFSLTAEEIRKLACVTADGGKPFETRRVAHAGGAIDGQTYTNSLEALDKNLKNGFTYFEIDFSFTSDDKLACAHDWGDNAKKLLNDELLKRPTYDEFKTLVKKADFNICTLESLIDWFNRHPSAYLITDIKERNLEGLAIIASVFPDFSERVIPQIYQPAEYENAKKMGYGKIIWTLYGYGGSNGEVLKWAEKLGRPLAITMDEGRAASSLPRQLKRLGIPSYVHTINSAEKKFKYINLYGITEIYTDNLLPIND